MRVTLQEIAPGVHVLRIHPDFDRDPNVYVGSACVVVEGGRAVIRGLVIKHRVRRKGQHAFTVAIYRATEAALAALGVAEMAWERRNIGEARWVVRVVRG